MKLVSANFFFNYPAVLNELFKAYSDPLELLKSIEIIIAKFFEGKTDKNPHQLNLDPTGSIFINSYIKTTSDYINTKYQIFISKDVVLEPSAYIKPGAIIFNDAQIRQGAYIRELSIIGPMATVGHNTEIKESIILQASAAGHFNYIGNSFIGNYVNLGAGSKLANLELRNLFQKQQNSFAEIKMPYLDKNYSLVKFGALVGDGCDIGCNSVLAPGCILEPEVKIWPNKFVKKGYYEANQKIV